MERNGAGMNILGIDIGGSGIKAAPVDVETGTLAGERLRVGTPQPSQPEAVADVMSDLVKQFAWQGPIGCTFPAVIKHGVAWSAANVDSSWIGTNGQELFEQKTCCPVLLLNDADAAGLAEMQFGAGRGREGVVMVLTFGTGIGSAVFLDGKLLPNTELGHLELRGKDAEHRASEAVREIKKLSWKQWAERVNEYLSVLEKLFSPDLFIFGGGVSRKHEKFFSFLQTRAEIVPAQLLNNAGIVGAALAVAHPDLLAGSIYQEKLSV
jgi:polyphosphate glucokinase